MCIFTINVQTSFSQTNPDKPNILLIIADDLGVDVFNGYQDNAQKPVTPHLDSLRQSGVGFRNAWAAPQCTPTRAAIMSGKYGVKSGVPAVPGHLDPIHQSIFSAIKQSTNNTYSNAAIGKWHISDESDLDHPADLGVEYYEGVYNSSPNPSYTNWKKTLGGLNHIPSTVYETQYATSFLTDKAIDWIDIQTQPWFLWLAHVAPHSPYHVPPDPQTYSQDPTNNNLQKYIAMIEAMDFEIGRLLDNMEADVRENTTIIFIGDHGAGNGVSQNYPNGHNKGTLYQGAVHAPLFACGKHVTRQNVWEDALVHATDIYATILELVGLDLDGGIYNSFSFLPQLQSENAPRRKYNYTEIKGDTISVTGYAIRNEQYKYIRFDDGKEEMYDLTIDSLELFNIINDPGLSSVLYDLKREALQINLDWSCLDMIANGNEIGVDCGTAKCGQCTDLITVFNCNEHILDICDDIEIDSFVVAESQIIDQHGISAEQVYFQAKDCVLLESGFSFTGLEFEIQIDDCELDGIDDVNCPSSNALNHSNIGCSIVPTEVSEYDETISGDHRIIVTNNYPNHNHDAKNNANIPMPQAYSLQVNKVPSIYPVSTSILNSTNRPRWFFGVALNGVILAPAPAAPFIFINTQTGEFNYDWIFEPTNNKGPGAGWVALDCASAHTGPQGYHYHGNMVEYAEVLQSGISTATSSPSNVIQLGWAADGFPILYRFGPDSTGGLALLQPSYRLQYGNRPGDGLTAPCGSYNGKYTNDYEYVDCLGDLDECNGIQRQVTIPTVEGDKTFDYFYVVTDEFPQIGRCLRGLPDPSFK